LKALIDGDMLLYQVGFIGQPKDPDTGEVVIRHFETVKDSMDRLIEDIVEAAGANEYTIYLTGKGNFREEIAKRQPYKESRDKEDRPFHYENLKAYLTFSYEAVIVEGMEADDAMVIAQMEDYLAYQGRFAEGFNTIICSRDKDLRMVPGWHYSWECHNQPERTPYFVDELGKYTPIYHPTKTYKDGSPQFKKLEATGLRLFYAQILMGDKVDTIPGLPGIGDKKAYEALNGCVSEMELYEVCLGMYVEKYPENALEELLEQARLVWMVRELNEDGSPVMWETPE
jgi:5'-3' exonuclease